MAQAQGVAELMDGHRKQVRPLAIWGGRMRWSQAPPPALAPPGSPGERGLLVHTSSQETPEVAVASSVQTPSLSHLFPPLWVHLFGG